LLEYADFTTLGDDKLIIGLMGLAGTGKSTVGRILKDEYGFIPVSFASSLKDAVAVLFHWPRHLLEGDTAESREWREKEDVYWSQVFAKPVTPRWVLQYMGTEVIRNNLHGAFWIHSLGAQIQNNAQKDYVITDMRFFNEIDYVQGTLKGFVVQIVNSHNEPHWSKWLMAHAPVGSAPFVEHKLTDEFKVHRSEWEHVWWRRKNVANYVLNNDFDVAENASTMENLSASVQHMIRVFTGPKDQSPVKNKALDTAF
jgi:hypothetical protein